MNARRVNAAAEVIHAAQKTRQTAAGIAAALEAAGLLQFAEDSHEQAVDAYLSTPYTDDRALVEDPHDSPLHHTYALGRDLPEVSS
ncbi:hypothetical protein AB0891_25415 [Streptomyces sp. NPDC007259]|uniref:hypothetical protein n=1 Tax=Streptomyces sp. NPDC007259 TaxID=3154319 RepID=UPI003453432B